MSDEHALDTMGAGNQYWQDVGVHKTKYGKFYNAILCQVL